MFKYAIILFVLSATISSAQSKQTTSGSTAKPKTAVAHNKIAKHKRSAVKTTCAKHERFVAQYKIAKHKKSVAQNKIAKHEKHVAQERIAKHENSVAQEKIAKQKKPIAHETEHTKKLVEVDHELPKIENPSHQDRINPASEPPLNKQESEKLIHELREKKLTAPIAGFDLQRIKGSFNETHGGVQHGAADFVSARNTPVLAVENGTIEKLFLSKAGGITIYQADPSKRFIYYYAHLEKYAPDLHEGQFVKRGETIGYVGTSGNAPKNTPHLHFSVGLAQEPKKWWATSSVDPYEVLR